MRGKSDKPAVFTITGARRSVSEDIQARQRRYVASMLFRTACFVGLIFTHGWVRILLLAGAVLLPYFAVIIANAGTKRPSAAPPTIRLPSDRASLGGESATGPTTGPGHDATTDDREATDSDRPRRVPATAGTDTQRGAAPGDARAQSGVGATEHEARG